MDSANKLVVIPLQELIAQLEELFIKLRNQTDTPYNSHTEGSKKILTRNEAAMLLNVSPNTITRWHRKGYITAAIINGQYRFFESDLLKQINRKKA